MTCVVIVTDSYYVVENLPRAHQWKKQKWRNRHGEPKFNDDLWNRLLKLKPKIRVRVDFIWEKGKKSEITRLVDKAAKSAPTGSEFAFAAVKSAMTAANQAYDALTKASKQVADMTEASISTAPSASRKKAA